MNFCFLPLLLTGNCPPYPTVGEGGVSKWLHGTYLLDGVKPWQLHSKNKPEALFNCTRQKEKKKLKKTLS